MVANSSVTRNKW